MASPRACFDSPPILAFESFSCFQLVEALLAAGWLPESDTKYSIVAAAPYTATGAKVFYLMLRTLAVSRFYLLCLLDADAILADGVPEIKHGGPVALACQLAYTGLHMGFSI